MEKVLPVLMLLIGLLLVAWFAVVVLKRRYRRMMEQDAVAPAGFTLSDLRALHKSGKMTDAEYARAREVVLGADRGATQQQAKRAN